MTFRWDSATCAVETWGVLLDQPGDSPSLGLLRSELTVPPGLLFSNYRIGGRLVRRNSTACPTKDSFTRPPSDGGRYILLIIPTTEGQILDKSENRPHKLAVQWDVAKCCHSANCVKSLPSVFAVEDGQFVIRAEAAPEADVRRVVAACPANALTVSP